MGISATGQHGLRAQTVPVLLLVLLGGFSVFYFLLGPSVTPGFRDAAEQKCNVLNGSNYRSYRLEWKLPKGPNWDAPHWLCKDARDFGKPGVDFGWWVDPSF